MTDPTNDATRERKMRQIQNLLNLAADERTPEGERETAMNRAMALMAEHGVTEMMIDARQRSQVDELIRRKINIANPYGREKMMLAHEIASVLNCKTTYQHLGRTITSITLFGYRSDIERVEMLYTSLLLQAVHAVNGERPGYWASAAETRLFRRNFLVGFARRVATRLWVIEDKAREQHDAQNTSSDTGGTALVLATRKTQVDSFFEEQNASVKFGKKSSFSYGGDGIAEGARAGARANLGTGGSGITGNRTAIGR